MLHSAVVYRQYVGASQDPGRGAAIPGMNGPSLEDAGAIAAPPIDAPVAGRAAWFLVTFWLLGTAGAFWFFELRGEPLQGTIAQSFALAAAAPVEAWYREFVGPNAAPGARFTLVRLHAPQCACDRDNSSATQKIEAEFQPRGVRFMDVADERLRTLGVTAAPAALVFDAAGRLVYYGPYGSSSWCGGSGELIESTLERVFQGGVRFTTSPVARGCFCTS
jgi:hypothetical protein